LITIMHTLGSPATLIFPDMCLYFYRCRLTTCSLDIAFKFKLWENFSWYLHVYGLVYIFR
jgi:hypothetical protein